MKYLRVEMEDGSKYDIPVSVIAEHRANCYIEKYGGDLQRSLNEDTDPLFKSDDYEIEDWAANNMNWNEVESVAVKVPDCGGLDYQEGWVNGDKEIVEKD